MFRWDPAGIAYSVAAVVFVVVGVVTWRRRAHNPTVAGALVFVMAGSCWWAVADALTVAAVNETVAGVAALLIFPGLCTAVAGFVCLTGTIARPQWVPGRRIRIALLTEPVLITLASVTNPWHGLVFTGEGTATLIGAVSWDYGLVFWVHSAYSYAALAVGIAVVAYACWDAPPAFRAQRLSVLVAVLVPLAVNVVNIAGGLPVDMDPTPVGLAVTGIVTAYAVFRQHLFTFTPVARALIIEQIGDAIIALSPVGRVLDLNPAAVALVRRMRPGLTDTVGVPAQDILGPVIAGTGHGSSEVSVSLDGGPAVLDVRGSALVDRSGRSLGSVLVVRDVTEVKAQSLRLERANAQLTQQVQTIERLRADLAELASRDPLTGLHNRRHMVERFETMLGTARARSGTLAVVLLDADRFKVINDTHGHLAGDAVLVEIARRLTRAAPSGTLVARWGGEEFVAVLPGADAADGVAFAETVRRDLAADGVVVGETPVQCTVSGGVATYPTCGATATELFHEADVALYDAKASGRDQVLVAAPSLRRAVSGAAVRAGGLVSPVPAADGPGSGGGDPH